MVYYELKGDKMGKIEISSVECTEKELRKGDFRLGRVHGKLQAEKPRSEAHLQRIVFLSQKLNLILARKTFIQIRLFGYEVPLICKVSRGNCVDLMGYDEKHNLYIIELKDEKAKDRIRKIEEQINNYEKKIRQIVIFIQKDFEKEFYLPVIFNKEKFYKIVLAPKKFYNPQQLKDINCLDNNDIIFADFGGRDIFSRKLGKPINIHLKKKCIL